MRSIEIVLQEEYERQKLLIMEYKSQISELPKGSISQKTIKGKTYAYLKEWKNGRTETVYIGVDGEDSVDEMRSQIEKRKELEQKLKKAKDLVRQMEKGIKIKK